MNLTRKMFPALSGNSYVYLNSGGSGPPSRETIAAMREADDLCSGPAYLEGTDFYAHQRDLYARAREAAGRLVNVAPDDLALTQAPRTAGTSALCPRLGQHDEVVRDAGAPGCLAPGTRWKALWSPVEAISLRHGRKGWRAMTPKRTRSI